ncbi:MAG: response regulator transcription factor [Lachnospiraceae bacterium]|jgi:DNA-binding response OmpR family regulator|nr:response regulator transcription factor [Lachnospiraceae bacterium]
MKILIIEDDETLAGEMASFLVRWGYETHTIRRFDSILEEFREIRPQLVLMDINLPFYDGFYWCARIRQVSRVPILYISSRSDDRDKIMAMAQGGDDYVEKPFHLDLLKAKIQAILRRTYEYKVKEQIFLGDNLYIDGEQQALFMGEKEIFLTKSERKILMKLAEKRPDVVTREELMMALWETDEYVSDGTLTTLISRLRSRLRTQCGREMIATKKGQGYFLQ